VKVKKLVILAAGLGTRFLPITKGVSKEMLPLVDEPIIHKLVEEGRLSGIEDIYVVIGDKRESLKYFYGKDEVLETKLRDNNKIEELDKVIELSNINVHYIYQKEALGTGYALLLAEEYIGDEPFAVMYGDDLFKGEVPAISEAIELYEKYDSNVMGMVTVPHELTYKYGVLKLGDNNKVLGIVEKPKVEDAPSNYVFIGRLILKPEIFSLLKNVGKTNGEYYLTDALNVLMERGEMYACSFSSKYFDTGNKLSYLKASLAYAFDDENMKKEIIEFIKNYE